MLKNVKRVAIICGYSFPEGLAPSTRVLTYAKGLSENGVEVSIYVYFPTDRNPSRFSVDGSIDGVSYHYPNTRQYPENLILRKLCHFYYMFITVKKYYLRHKIENYNITIISSDWFRILYFFIPILNFLNTKIVFIADEYPVPIRVRLKNKLPKWRKVLFRIILNRVDGMIFMTNNLKEFFNTIVLKPSFVLPSITDLSRFSERTIIRKDLPKYICYMGNMELSKDNVDNIIEAFNLIKNKYIDFQLHLYGAPNSKDLKIINQLITKYNLSERVFLKGVISNKKVSLVLSESILLVSSQPDTKRAHGGFPTKLGEYMATGVPMLVTDVGEISKYVTHGLNGWLAKPENPIDYAMKMEFIFDNYTEALNVAANGKKYVYENFDSNLVTKEMIFFFNNL